MVVVANAGPKELLNPEKSASDIATHSQARNICSPFGQRRRQLLIF
jgi:hypothetical protein